MVTRGPTGLLTRTVGTIAGKTLWCVEEGTKGAAESLKRPVQTIAEDGLGCMEEGW